MQAQVQLHVCLDLHVVPALCLNYVRGKITANHLRQYFIYLFVIFFCDGVFSCLQHVQDTQERRSRCAQMQMNNVWKSSPLVVFSTRGRHWPFSFNDV